MTGDLVDWNVGRLWPPELHNSVPNAAAAVFLRMAVIKTNSCWKPNAPSNICLLELSLYQAKKLDTLRAAHYSMAAQRSYKKRTLWPRQQDENCRRRSRRDGRSAESQKPQMVRKVPKKRGAGLIQRPFDLMNNSGEVGFRSPSRPGRAIIPFNSVTS